MVKTNALMRSKVWFPGLDAMVEDRVQRGATCQTLTGKPVYEPQSPLPMPLSSWSHVSADFYGPNNDGNFLDGGP